MSEINQIEYLNLTSEERELLPFNAKWVYDWFSDTLDQDNRQDSETLGLHVILNRLTWAYSRLNTINMSQKYDKEDAMLLIIAFIFLYTALNALQGSSAVSIKILSDKRAPYFKGTIDSNFPRNSTKSRTDREFVEFLRTISFAHVLGANKFFQKGYEMMSISLNGISASPTIEQVYDTNYIYIHVIYKTPKTAKPKILNVNKDELKKCIMAFSGYGEKLYKEWRRQNKRTKSRS